MGKFRDLTGQNFGKWSIIRWVKKNYGEQFWLCKCECGAEKVIIGGTLKTGRSTSCGCVAKDWCRKHGMEGTSIYNIWAGINQRCNNPKHRNYKNYGGRGIKMCQEWRDSFEQFYKDMGDKPEGMSIDRIDNNRHYEPSNCKWSTGREQNNNRRKTRMIEYQGEMIPVVKLAEIAGVSPRRMYNRINQGYSLGQIMSPEKLSRWDKK